MATQEVTDYFKARSVCDDELATRDELVAAYHYVVCLGGPAGAWSATSRSSCAGSRTEGVVEGPALGPVYGPGGDGHD